MTKHSKWEINVLHLEDRVRILTGVRFPKTDIIFERAADPPLTALTPQHVAGVVPGGENIENATAEETFDRFIRTYLY